MASDKQTTLTQWIDHVFDHPADEGRWYHEDEAPVWNGSLEESTRYIAEAFEQSGRLLGRFADDQLEQGFWYLVSLSGSDFMMGLTDSAVPTELRLRALRSFGDVFEQVMAVRCSPHLSHLDEQGANPLNGSCYMWWDILMIVPEPENKGRQEFDRQALRVMERILAVPHDACRESSLHGLNHWSAYPEASRIIDDFLRRERKIRPELIAYAVEAKEGMAQ